MASNRYLGKVTQGEDEECTYTADMSAWGSGVSSPTVVVKTADGTVVTDTVTEGSASASNDVITTPTIKSLTAWTQYRVELSFTLGGNTLEAFFRIDAEE